MSWNGIWDHWKWGKFLPPPTRVICLDTRCFHRLGDESARRGAWQSRGATSSQTLETEREEGHFHVLLPFVGFGPTSKTGQNWILFWTGIFTKYIGPSACLWFIHINYSRHLCTLYTNATELAKNERSPFFGAVIVGGGPEVAETFPRYPGCNKIPDLPSQRSGHSLTVLSGSPPSLVIIDTITFLFS